jgi:pimeloyl-ACP methyl ester carboxylesterase
MKEVIDISVKFLNKTHDTTIKMIGEKSGIPCIVIGPASLYLPVLAGLTQDSHFRLYGIDSFWTKGHTFSSQEINSITLEGILTLYKNIINTLKSSKSITEKVIIIGPSILGWFAEELAATSPEDILGVVKLNTPTRNKIILKQWSQLQQDFMQVNFHDFYPHEKWSFYIQWKKEFEKRSSNEQASKYSNDEKYDAELNRDRPKYFYHFKSQTNNETVNLFKLCALDSRQKIAEIAFHSNENFQDEVPVPIWQSVGIADGIVPIDSIAADISRMDHQPNEDCYIFEEAGHIPSEDRFFSDKVYQVACQWKQASQTKDSTPTSYSKYALFTAVGLTACYLMRKDIAAAASAVKGAIQQRFS